MRQPGTPGFAGPLYTSQDQMPGPCYVLCPKRWRKGARFVLAVLDPILPPTQLNAATYPAPTQIGTRQVVTFPRGKPWAWRLKTAPVYRTDPSWHARARRLRAQGLSYRAVALEVGKDEKAVRNVVKS